MTHTWGLGGMALVLFLLQIVSGVFLLFVYKPDIAGAYDSVVSLQRNVLFGGFLRNIHHWSANFLVPISLLHMLRAFYTGAFCGARSFNWIIGLCLLTMVLGANLTGYLLPWDQMAYWAVTICTGMLDYIPLVGSSLKHLLQGGAEVGSATLSNFFVLHVMMFPLCLVVLLAFHFWRIRNAGGVVLPRMAGEAILPSKRMVPSAPNLVVRELAMAAAVLAVIFMLAALLDAPLQATANPGLSPNPSKPPWYFSGFQELFLHLHPTIVVLVLPLLSVVGLCLLPYLIYETKTEGVWFASTTGRKTALFAAVVAIFGTLASILLDEWLLKGGGASHSQSGQSWLRMLAAGGILIAMAGPSLFARKYFSAGKTEMVQAALTFALTTMVILTVIGVWFRGPGMALMWCGWR
ncbi:MAG: cytochrome b N-terminal domain-containing protein [Desulfobacteraceae bacterium]|nr:cytochrome b N-terminal domain-containing protein [Desulfobacteraceae bacterium]